MSSFVGFSLVMLFRPSSGRRIHFVPGGLQRQIDRIDPRDWQFLERFRQPEKEADANDRFVFHVFGGTCALVIAGSIALIMSSLIL